jgi:hypothetical protein
VRADVTSELKRTLLTSTSPSPSLPPSFSLRTLICTLVLKFPHAYLSGYHKFDHMLLFSLLLQGLFLVLSYCLHDSLIIQRQITIFRAMSHIPKFRDASKSPAGDAHPPHSHLHLPQETPNLQIAGYVTLLNFSVVSLFIYVIHIFLITDIFS